MKFYLGYMKSFLKNLPTFFCVAASTVVCSCNQPKENQHQANRIHSHLNKDTCTGLVEYYDSVSHSLKHFCAPVTVSILDAKLLSFPVDSNKVIDTTQFLSRNTLDDNDNADITLRNGKH